jgi:hypothetical protein
VLGGKRAAKKAKKVTAKKTKKVTKKASKGKSILGLKKKAKKKR